MTILIFLGYVLFAILMSAIIFFFSKLVISYFKTFIYHDQRDKQSVNNEQQVQNTDNG